MAAELFGTPLGDIAYHEDQLTQNKSLALMGQLAEVPSKIALQTAQASEQGALAAKNWEAVKHLQQVSQWDDAYRASLKKAELDDQRKFAEIKPLITGQSATVGDLPKSGRIAQMSLAAPIIDRAEWLRKNGAPSDMYQPLYKEGQAMQAQEGIANFRNSQAEYEQIKVERERRQLRADTYAKAASGPLGFAMLTPEEKQLLPPVMFEAGIPYSEKQKALAVMRDKDLGYVKATEIELHKAAAKRADTALVNDTNKTNAYVTESGVKVKTLTEQLDIITKTGLANSKAGIELRDAAARAKDEQVLAVQLKSAPWLPLDPKSDRIKPEAKFTLKDQSVVRVVSLNGVVQRDSQGRPLLERIKQAPATRRELRAAVLGTPTGAAPSSYIAPPSPAITKAPAEAAPEPLTELDKVDY